MSGKSKQRNQNKKRHEKVVTKHGKKEVGLVRIAKEMPAPITLHGAVKHMTALNVKIQSLKTASAAGWSLLSKDNKDDSATLAAELKAFAAFARASISTSTGGKAIPFCIPLTASFTATVTTGVVNQVLAVTVSDSPEWASIVALFDEYRFVRGAFAYVVIAPTSTIVLGTSTLTNNANFSIGYDPSDASQATDVKDILQLEQHQQLAPRIVPTATTGTYVGVYGRSDCKPFDFEFDVSRYALVSSSVTGVGTLAVGVWKSTQSSPLGDGTIKVYYQSGYSTAVQAISGTVYYHILLKSRT